MLNGGARSHLGRIQPGSRARAQKLGISLVFALPSTDDEVAALGYIPLSRGVAYLICYTVEGRKLLVEAAEGETKQP